MTTPDGSMTTTDEAETSMDVLNTTDGDTEKPKTGGLSSGAVAGIAVGVIVLVVLVTLLIIIIVVLR